jgi:hypothetical protein
LRLHFWSNESLNDLEFSQVIKQKEISKILEIRQRFISIPNGPESRLFANRGESTSNPNNLEPELCNDQNSRNHSNRMVDSSHGKRSLEEGPGLLVVQ